MSSFLFYLYNNISAAISPDRDDGETPTPPQRQYLTPNQMSQAPPTWNPMPTSVRDPLVGGYAFQRAEDSSKMIKTEEPMPECAYNFSNFLMLQ